MGKELIWERVGVPYHETKNLRQFLDVLNSHGDRLPDPKTYETTLAWWNSNDVKLFRNAMALFAIEEAWPGVEKIFNSVSKHPQFKLALNTSGVLICVEYEAPLSTLEDRARSIGESAEAVLNTELARVVQDGGPRQIHGSNYWHVFGDIARYALENECFERKVPRETDPRIAFWIRGVRGIRVLFDSPNLICTKAAEKGIKLNTNQHRSAQLRLLRGSVAESYLPPLQVLEVFNDVMLDKEQLVFKPQAFDSKGNADSFEVFPQEDLLRPRISQVGDLPIETHCPFFSAKDRDTGQSLPRRLETFLFTQLERWYYPFYQA